MTDTVRYDKLVRDRVPKVLQDLRLAFGYHRVVNPDAFVAALRTKLVEEATEVTEAQSRGETLAELGDLLDVVDALCVHLKATPQELMQARVDKHKARGGFDKGYILEWVERDDGPDYEVTTNDDAS